MLLDFNVVYKNIVKANNNYIDLTSDNNNIKFIEDTRQGYYYSKDKEIPIAIEYYEKNAEHILREYIIRISYMKFKYENPEYMFCIFFVIFNCYRYFFIFTVIISLSCIFNKFYII